jgi:hypothetical protein
MNMDAEGIAAAAAAHGEVTGVLAAESAAGRRSWLVALGEDEGRQWLVLDAGGAPVGERMMVREVASLVAMSELAAELAGEDDVARVASPSYLDEVGTPEVAAVAGVVDAFVAEVEKRYLLPLG